VHVRVHQLSAFFNTFILCFKFAAVNSCIMGIARPVWTARTYDHIHAVLEKRLEKKRKEKKRKTTQGWLHHKHGLRKWRRCCRTAKYSRYQADSNPQPQRVWPDHGPLGSQGSYPWGSVVQQALNSSFCRAAHLYHCTTLAFCLCFSPVSSSFYFLGPHNCSSFFLA
jgi:hypothetical protein